MYVHVYTQFFFKTEIARTLLRSLPFERYTPFIERAVASLAYFKALVLWWLDIHDFNWCVHQNL
jgi:hypothetical protein